MKATSLERKDFMSGAQKKAMGNLPRHHAVCLAKTGVARPGKTAKDRARRLGLEGKALEDYLEHLAKGQAKTKAAPT